jgi:hypothetical protein
MFLEGRRVGIDRGSALTGLVIHDREMSFNGRAGESALTGDRHSPDWESMIEKQGDGICRSQVTVHIRYSQMFNFLRRPGT